MKRIKDFEVRNEILIKKLDNQYKDNESLSKKNQLLNEKNSVINELKDRNAELEKRNSQLEKLFHDVNDKYISTRNELARRNDNLRSNPSAKNCDDFSFEYESCKSEVMKCDNIKFDKP